MAAKVTQVHAGTRLHTIRHLGARVHIPTHIHTHTPDSQLIHITPNQSHTATPTHVTLMAHSSVTLGHLIVPLCPRCDAAIQMIIETHILQQSQGHSCKHGTAQSHHLPWLVTHTAINPQGHTNTDTQSHTSNHSIQPHTVSHLSGLRLVFWEMRGLGVTSRLLWGRVAS